MFDRVGARMQTVARVVCWFGIIVSVLIGLAAIFSGSGFAGVIGGLISAALGAVLSWAGSLTLYGFGQLIEDVHAMSLRKGV